MSVFPNSRNVIPGEVRFSVRFRSRDDAEIERLDREFRQEATAVAAASRVNFALTELFRVPALAFASDCVDLVRRSGLPARDMISGAAHDAVYVRVACRPL